MSCILKEEEAASVGFAAAMVLAVILLRHPEFTAKVIALVASTPSLHLEALDERLRATFEEELKGQPHPCRQGAP